MLGPETNISSLPDDEIGRTVLALLIDDENGSWSCELTELSTEIGELALAADAVNRLRRSGPRWRLRLPSRAARRAFALLSA